MSVPLMFGRFLVMKGKINDQELTEALNVQSELNTSFAEELLQGEHITMDQFRKAWSYQREKFITFKEAVVELKMVGNDVIKQINSSCADKYIMLGELLVQKGALSAGELETALEEFRNGGYMTDL